jgi:hypothetical protein
LPSVKGVEEALDPRTGQALDPEVSVLPLDGVAASTERVKRAAR